MLSITTRPSYRAGRQVKAAFAPAGAAMRYWQKNRSFRAREAAGIRLSQERRE